MIYNQLMCNPDLIHRIHDTHPPITVYTNSGSQVYESEASLKLFPFDVYYNPDSIANIISLSEVSSQYRITMNLPSI